MVNVETSLKEAMTSIEGSVGPRWSTTRLAWLSARSEVVKASI